MNQPGKPQERKKDLEQDRRPHAPASNDDRPPPTAPPRTMDDTPDDAVEGRDRLSENEDRRMDPGIADSSHS